MYNIILPLEQSSIIKITSAVLVTAITCFPLPFPCAAPKGKKEGREGRSKGRKGEEGKGEKKKNLQ